MEFIPKGYHNCQLSFPLRILPSQLAAGSINIPAQGSAHRGGNAAAFQKTLEDGGIPATVRRTLGGDIDASCGQLRRKYTKGK